jgi:hypothetical protein
MICIHCGTKHFDDQNPWYDPELPLAGLAKKELEDCLHCYRHLEDKESNQGSTGRQNVSTSKRAQQATSSALRNPLTPNSARQNVSTSGSGGTPLRCLAIIELVKRKISLDKNESHPSQNPALSLVIQEALLYNETVLAEGTEPKLSLEHKKFFKRNQSIVKNINQFFSYGSSIDSKSAEAMNLRSLLEKINACLILQSNLQLQGKLESAAISETETIIIELGNIILRIPPSK